MIIIPVSSGSNSIRQVIIRGYVRFEVLMAVKLPDYTTPHTQYPCNQGYCFQDTVKLPDPVTLNILSLIKEFLGNLVSQSGTHIQ